MSLLSVLKSLWHAWSIRSCILLSLMLQAFLLLVAPLRKRPPLKQRFKEPFFGLVWLAYIQREWFNIFVIGLMSWNNGDPSKPKDGNEDFMALWASFLLLQAGGPDAITSFAIEDNQLWLRHLLQLTLQVLLTANIFCLSFPQSKIWIPAAMMFLAGTISYAERVYALYLACLDRSGPSEPRKPYHGLDYEEALRLHCSVSAVDVAKRARGMPRAGEYAANSKNTSEDDNQELVIRSLTRASRFLDMLKGFIRGTIFSSIRIEESKEYFLNTKLDEASRVIEYELSFLYDLLHTKVVVFRNRQGYILRAFCFLLILAALIVFLFLEKQHKFPDKLDVNLSYALLWGTLVIELINALSLMFSDWTVIALKDSWRKFFPEFILERLLKRQRWSRSCFQYDMISYCLNGPPTWLSKWAAFMHLGETLDKLYIWLFSNSRMVETHMEEFIFGQLKNRSLIAKNLEGGMEACSQRGDRALMQSRHGWILRWSIEEYQYGESLLLWHVATEICYQKHLKDKEKGLKEQKEMEAKFDDEICKQISDYMFYLFLMQHKLIAPMLGSWERAFDDTCIEAKRFFERKRLKGPDQKRACEEIFNVKTPIRPTAVKGSNCKSVLFDANILAKELQKLGNDQWRIMSEVWMELMSYAGINSKRIQHTSQLSRGGELLTFVWLLMNHLGLGTPFCKCKYQNRANMVNIE